MRPIFACGSSRFTYLRLVVDAALEVVEEYQAKILKIEQEVLLNPSMETVRRRASLSLSACIASSLIPSPVQCTSFRVI